MKSTINLQLPDMIEKLKLIEIIRRDYKYYEKK